MLQKCLQNLLDFIVQHKYEGTASTTEYVGEGTLEEGATTLLFGDGSPAVQCALVDDLGLGTTRLHHHATTDGIEGIRHDTGDGGDDLSNRKNKDFSINRTAEAFERGRDTDLSDGPADIPRGGLWIWQHTASCVVEAEVGRTVDDNTLDGYAETAIQTNQAIRFEDL